MRTTSLLLFLWGLPGPSEAQATQDAMVKNIAVMDRDGQWDEVDQSGETTCIHGESQVPCAIGVSLEFGDRIITRDARVQVELTDKGIIDIRENAEISIQEQSIIQKIGNVYYRLERSFTVSFDQVEATVEGTEFLVSGPEPVSVSVVQGKVKVAREGNVFTVPAGRKVEALQGRFEDTKLSGRSVRSIINNRYVLGKPKTRIGGAGELGHTGKGGGRVMIARRLTRHLDYTVDTTFLRKGLNSDLLQGLGLEVQRGWLSLGFQGIANIETTQSLRPIGINLGKSGGRTYHLGFGLAGTAKVEIPVGPTFKALPTLRVGRAQSVLVDGGLGLGLGF